MIIFHHVVQSHFPVGDGFCDHSLFFESPDNRGFYNWSETELGSGGQQAECFYGPVDLEEGGKAVRACRVRYIWENEVYNGAQSECITLATYRLRQLANVSVIGLQIAGPHEIELLLL